MNGTRLSTRIGRAAAWKLRRAAATTLATVTAPVYRRSPARVLTAEQRRFWDENGYLVLPGHFSKDHVAQVNAFLERLWDPSMRAGRKTVVDVFIGTPRERRMHFRDAPVDAKALSHKINDLFLEDDIIRQMVLEERLSAILGDLLDGAPLVCNTLNLTFGSQQGEHTDSLFMAAPDRTHLVASWIALEDCTLDAGPLRYYPGSHLIPPYVFSTGSITAVADEMSGYQDYMRREIERRGLVPNLFEARAGDVFIWHSQLFHGGEPIRSPGKTRRSLVTHYWRARDVFGLHGRLGPGRYWLRREPQRVDAPPDDH